jgi:hypothetical protein
MSDRFSFLEVSAQTTRNVLKRNSLRFAAGPIVKLANSWQIALLRDIPQKGKSENSRVFTGDFDGGPGWT